MRAHLVDGSAAPVAIPHRGKHRAWGQLAKILDRLDWLRFDALDPKGQIVAVVENDQADELEEDEPASKRVHEQAQLLELMLRGQRDALQANHATIATLLESVYKLINTLTERVVALEKSNARSHERYLQLTAQLAEGGSDAEGMLSALLPAVLSGGVAPPRLPNGGAKKKR